MSDLHPCSRCFRHIRSAEIRCPFCGAKKLKRAKSRARTGVGAATLASAASLACVAHPDPGPREPREAPSHAASAAAPASTQSSPKPADPKLPIELDAGTEPPEPPPKMRMVAIYGESTVLVLRRVLFAEGSARVTADQRAALEEVVDVVKNFPLNPRTDRPLVIEIEGHADPREKNVSALAKRRAEAVRAELVKLGIPKERLTLSRHGADRPLAPSDSSEHRQLNRRVSFQIGSEQ